MNNNEFDIKKILADAYTRAEKLNFFTEDVPCEYIDTEGVSNNGCKCQYSIEKGLDDFERCLDTIYN